MSRELKYHQETKTRRIFFIFLFLYKPHGGSLNFISIKNSSHSAKSINPREISGCYIRFLWKLATSSVCASICLNERSGARRTHCSAVELCVSVVRERELSRGDEDKKCEWIFNKREEYLNYASFFSFLGIIRCFYIYKNKNGKN